MERAGAGVNLLRQLVPRLFGPLCLLASVLCSAPWLRAFPASVGAVPLYGAALVSVLVPLATVRLFPRSVWAAVAVDVAVFVAYCLAVVLREPTGFADLIRGLYQGPSQVLTFALPLVSPRTLLVAPTALAWTAGALAGQCLARRWYTLLPYFGFLVAFGLAYAGTQRAAGSDLAAARSRETVLAAGLLVTLLLMRVAQSWVRQDQTAESTQPDGVLPLRGIVVGTITALVVVAGAAQAVQTGAFPKRAESPQRVPSVNDSNPLTPLAFTAALRPRTSADPVQPVFTVRTDQASSGYFAIANVDSYDGTGWSFDRTFRPSGGVLPADLDPALQTTRVVNQQYRVANGPLLTGPWMPYLYRAQQVTGASVNIDPGSGMIVPAGRLTAGESYSVRSTVTATTFDRLDARGATADTTTPTVDTDLTPGLRATLDRVVTAFTEETGVPSAPALPFLQAVQRDLRTRYALSGAAQGSSGGGTTPSGSPGPSASPAPPASSSPPAGDLAGGTGFADVLASILGPTRNGTPEQFATLVALIARDLDVPARVSTGFRVVANAPGALPAGQYTVATANAWSWAEIPIVGRGWLVLDAAPGRFTPDTQQTESAVAPPPTSSAPPSQNALVTPANNGHAVAPRSTVPASSSAPRDTVLLVLAVLVGVLLLALLVLLAARKPVRARRRRRAPDPRTRVIGAWQESLDVLSEAGLPELATLTSTEIAELTTEQFGEGNGQTVATLGGAADAVTYYPGTVVAPEDADAAWADQRALRKGVRAQLRPGERVAAALRYHRRQRVKALASPPSWAISVAAAREQARPRRTASRREYRGRRRAH